MTFDPRFIHYTCLCGWRLELRKDAVSAVNPAPERLECPGCKGWAERREEKR